MRRLGVVEAEKPQQWDEVVSCRLCGHRSRAQYKRTGYRPGWWLCINRRACARRQRKREDARARAATITALAIALTLAIASTASATTSCGEVIGYHADVYIEQTGTTCHVAEVLFESGVDIRRPPAVFTIAPFKCWNHGIGVGSPTFIEGARRRVVFCEGRRSSVQITLATHPARRCTTEAGPIPDTQVEHCSASS